MFRTQKVPCQCKLIALVIKVLFGSQKELDLNLIIY